MVLHIEDARGVVGALEIEAEPSKRSEDSCTQRRKRMNSSRELGPLPKRLSSSQAPLMASHISTVSAVRTARALVRASSKQLRIDDGLALEKHRNSVTVSSLASLWEVENACAQPAVATADSHSLVAPT